MGRIKRILLIIAFIITMLPIFVFAGTELGTSTQYPIVGSSFYVQLDMMYCDSNQQDCTNYYIRDFHAIVTYDPTYFEFEKISWIQSSGSYSDDKNGNIYIDKETGYNWPNGAILQMKFKVKKSGLSQINIKRNGESHYVTGDIIGQSFAGIYIGAKEPSTSVLLSGLYIKGFEIQPTFNKMHNEYTLSVPSNIDNVEVIAQKGEVNQTITGNGKRVLNYGENKIHVVVKAQDGTTNTYNINVVRTDDRTGDTTLKTLTVGDNVIPINEGIYSYETTVSRSSEKILLNAQTSDPNATLIGTGYKTLNIGQNDFILTVESSNGKSRQYYIKINRSTEDFQVIENSNKLQSIKVNSLSLDLSNDQNRWFYGINSDIDQLSINAVAESQTATVDIIGNENLKPGLNIIEIKVTEMKNVTEENPLKPEDTKTYTLVVYKNPIGTMPITSFDENYSNYDYFYRTTKPEDNIIPSIVLNHLHKEGKSIYYNVVNMYNGLLYQVIIPGFSTKEDLDVTFKKTSDYYYETKLSEGYEIYLNVSDNFNDNENVKIYTYNENNNYTLLTEGLTVQNGYIHFTTNGDKNYVITKISLIQEQGPIEKWFNKNKNIIFGIIGGIIFVLLIIVIITKMKKKSSPNEPLY